MKRRYFGTDGIRGRVGEGPISADFMLRLGRAAGAVLARDGARTVLIGKDTRISGYMFESALEAGLVASGANVSLLGPMPTPAVAYLTRTFHANAGIVISASHNPHQDNGIKFFSPQGEKLADALELAIEAELERPFSTVASEALGKVKRIDDAGGRYIEFCKATVDRALDLRGLRLVVDCANGAGYQVAPQVFRELGAQVEVIHNQPDGLNINLGCGSTQPASLQAAVRASGADLGIALDGDGDRVVFVDHDGQLVDGDELLYVLARDRVLRGQLRGPVVGTLMSNYGLELALSELGVAFERAAVGDRYVHQRLVETGGELGGESSGHLLCLDKATTGDGIVSALQVLEAVQRAGEPLAVLRAGMRRFPQLTRNVRLASGQNWAADPGVADARAAAERALAGRGRLVLRASGTEPVVRVTVEADAQELVEHWVARIADAVEAACAHPA